VYPIPTPATDYRSTLISGAGGIGPGHSESAS
jgi:hypothetical protein